jgi:hypothetical protein
MLFLGGYFFCERLNVFALLNVFGDGCSVSWTSSLMSKN